MTEVALTGAVIVMQPTLTMFTCTASGGMLILFILATARLALLVPQESVKCEDIQHLESLRYLRYLRGYFRDFTRASILIGIIIFNDATSQHPAEISKAGNLTRYRALILVAPFKTCDAHAK
ncbi:hypothetical protein I7I51_06239 [Histoplasma capsulatum]|uniref:Uncharacterized protein n=1 Tax=Ajellomyces capsulatus TaxID=5037 RepID=A0A8A1MFX3_AJECA|nr:hypothetical protein I7I51_06239 [Histoplasma capsulatum]